MTIHRTLLLPRMEMTMMMLKAVVHRNLIVPSLRLVLVRRVLPNELKYFFSSIRIEMAPSFCLPGVIDQVFFHNLIVCI